MNTWRGILTTICCFHARVSIRWQFMTLRDIRNGSRPKMKILTRRTLRRSANSLREPRSKIKPKGRLNRLVPTGKGHQRKAPLAQLPEHTPKLKQPPHLRRRACGSTTRKAPKQDRPSGARQDRQYIGEWQIWHGRWYQKVIRHGRIEWEQG